MMIRNQIKHRRERTGKREPMITSGPPGHALWALWLAVILLAAAGGSVAAVPEPAADPRLEALIAQRPAWDQDLAPYQITVEVKGAVVSLTGTVSTSAESHLARRIAEQTRGVQAVINGLKINRSPVPVAGSRSAPPDDAELERRVHESLANDANLHADYIDVRVERGRVTLSGTRVGRLSQAQSGKDHPLPLWRGGRAERHPMDDSMRA